MNPISTRWTDRRLPENQRAALPGNPNNWPTSPPIGDPGQAAPAPLFQRAQGVAQSGRRLRTSVAWVPVALTVVVFVAYMVLRTLI